MPGLLQFRVAQFGLETGLQLQRVPFALFSGQTEPGVSLYPVLGYAGAGEVKHRQAALGRCETLQGGLAQQVGGPAIVPVRFQGVVAAQFKSGGGVPLAGGFPDPAQRGLFVGRDAFPGDVAQPQVQLGGVVAPSGPLVEFGQGGRDGLIGSPAAGED